MNNYWCGNNDSVFSQSTRNVYTENLRGATQTDTYITCGDSIIQYYEPTYQISFRIDLHLMFLFFSVSLYMVFVICPYFAHQGH
jgi:hypothetical protein